LDNEFLDAYSRHKYRTVLFCRWVEALREHNKIKRKALFKVGGTSGIKGDYI
jgi:hypothetical protein